jgi:arylformamidase
MAKSAKSKWIDISIPIYAGMVGGPNDPKVEIKLVRDPDEGAPVTMALVTMISHTATPIDSPRHFYKDGTPVDELPLETFMGPARVIEIKDTVSIKPAELEKYDIQPGEAFFLKLPIPPGSTIPIHSLRPTSLSPMMRHATWSRKKSCSSASII